jgi:hypothetical protein
VAFTLGTCDLVATAGELCAEFNDRVLGGMVWPFLYGCVFLCQAVSAGLSRAKRGEIGERCKAVGGRDGPRPQACRLGIYRCGSRWQTIENPCQRRFLIQRHPFLSTSCSWTFHNKIWNSTSSVKRLSRLR